MLACHAYLRTGEVAGLRCGQIQVGEDGRGLVSLGMTKGRRMEVVHIDGEILERFFRAVMATKLPGGSTLGLWAPDSRKA